MTKKKAFTLIELLIVIAIIGILFIVLVSKVDFATDKAKASGVQTDFRSFQLAFETVSKEKAGFNSFGWDTGDDNANGVRDSVDEGDTNKDGIYQEGETWTGRKKYLETWTDKYSLIRPGTTFETEGYDKDAIFALETAINKNLDPKLHISIDAKTGLVTMANGAQDPWNTQYHGAYISAEDGMDRGAIVMYSNGANQKFGSEHDISNGVPIVIVPGNNKQGADDYSLVVCYTYTNGYGEVGALTTGFSNNQTFFAGNGDNNHYESDSDDITNTLDAGLYDSQWNMVVSWDSLIGEYGMLIEQDYTISTNKSISSSPYCVLNSIITNNPNLSDGVSLVVGNGIARVGQAAFAGCTNIVELHLPKTVTSIGREAFYQCSNLYTVKFEENSQLTTFEIWAFQEAGIVKIDIPDSVTDLGSNTFQDCKKLESIEIPDGVTVLEQQVFNGCSSLRSVKLSKNITTMKKTVFQFCSSLVDINLHELTNLTIIEQFVFNGCTSLPSLTIPDSVKTIGYATFQNCTFETIYFSENTQLETIDRYAFKFATLKYIDLPSTLKTIGEGAFTECKSLERVSFDNNTQLESIGRIAFYNCTALSNITYHNSVEKWNSMTISPASPFGNTLLTEITCDDGAVALN